MNEKYRMITKIVRNMKLKRNRIEDTLLNDNEQESMRFISKHNGCISSDLVNYLNVDKGLVTRIVKKLEDNGYIKVLAGSDKRKKNLFITDKGLELKLENQLFEIDYYKSLLEDIDIKDQEKFFEVLELAYLKSKKLRKEINE